MNTKLTLRLDDKLVRRAKSIARRSGKSVSRLVADYFSVLDRQPEDKNAFSPVVRSLLGVMTDGDGDRKAYRRHLEDKYR